MQLETEAAIKRYYFSVPTIIVLFSRKTDGLDLLFPIFWKMCINQIYSNFQRSKILNSERTIVCSKFRLLSCQFSNKKLLFRYFTTILLQFCEQVHLNMLPSGGFHILSIVFLYHFCDFLLLLFYVIISPDGYNLPQVFEPQILFLFDFTT